MAESDFSIPDHRTEKAAFHGPLQNVLRPTEDGAAFVRLPRGMTAAEAACLDRVEALEARVRALCHERRQNAP